MLFSRRNQSSRTWPSTCDDVISLGKVCHNSVKSCGCWELRESNDVTFETSPAKSGPVCRGEQWEEVMVQFTSKINLLEVFNRFHPLSHVSQSECGRAGPSEGWFQQEFVRSTCSRKTAILIFHFKNLTHIRLGFPQDILRLSWNSFPLF